MTTPDMSEFEQEMKGCEIAEGPWVLDGECDPAQLVALGRALGQAMIATMPDVVDAINKGFVPKIQYFYSGTGCTIEVEAHDERNFSFHIHMPADGPPFYNQS